MLLATRAVVNGRKAVVYVKNGQEVRNGDYLAVLSNTARTEDILHVVIVA